MFSPLVTEAVSSSGSKPLPTKSKRPRVNAGSSPPRRPPSEQRLSEVAEIDPRNNKVTKTPADTNKEVVKAQKIMDAKSALLADREMWANRPKARAVITAATALEQGASKLRGIPEGEELPSSRS